MSAFLKFFNFKRKLQNALIISATESLLSPHSPHSPFLDSTQFVSQAWCHIKTFKNLYINIYTSKYVYLSSYLNIKIKAVKSRKFKWKVEFWEMAIKIGFKSRDT